MIGIINTVLVDNNTLNTILEHFSIEKKTYSFQPINQGFINDTFLVLNDEAPVFILQRINHLVFKDVDGLMNNIGNALSYLKDSDYSFIALAKTEDGNIYCTHNNEQYWRLMSYIDQSTAYNTSTDPKIAAEAGRILGKFHQLLQKAPIADFADTIPQFHDLNLREDQFKLAMNQAASEKMETAKNAIVFAKETLVRLQELTQAELPLRICHNDPKLNNILFSKETKKALCLIDLDTIMKGYFYNDFGDAVRTIANTAEEDEQDHSKIIFDETLFEAFITGLKTNTSFLTKEELKSLPLGAAFMPFIHGLRALTDYLNNNVYYRVSYENQNLDRCLSLFNFTKKVLDKVSYMEAVIKREFKQLS